MSARGAAIRQALLFPAERATLLLQAALLDGDDARNAWREWRHGVTDVKETLAQDQIIARTLLPLLHASVRRNALDADDETLTYLRSAVAREALRAREYRRIVDALTSALEKRGAAFLLVKGAAVGDVFYSAEALRHSHDVELVMIDPIDGRALDEAGFVPRGDHYVHTSGLPLRVGDVLIPPNVRATMSDAWSVATTTHRPDATTSLAVALLHAARSRSRENGRWIADAQAIVRTREVEWEKLVALLRRARGCGIAAAQLQWLAERRFCDVPERVVRELAANESDPIERQIEVRGLYAGRRAWWMKLFRLSNVRGRVELLRATFFPRPAAVGVDGRSRMHWRRLRALGSTLAARWRRAANVE